jgi:hypothetical protein
MASPLRHFGERQAQHDCLGRSPGGKRGRSVSGAMSSGSGAGAAPRP